MFSSQIPLGALIEFCRGTRYTLESGLTLDKAMKTQSKKGPMAVRSVAARMAERLAEGDAFHDVLLDEKKYFPPLFLSLSAVAEETGKLPEALHELEEYFTFQKDLWRKFISQITFPVLQFVAAIGVITLLILILGMIPGNEGKGGISVLGLKGPDGAVKFLSFVVGSLVLLTIVYFVTRTILKKGHIVDGFLLSIPILGPALRTLAIARFCLSMAITVDAGTPMDDAVDLSLKATSNHAFASRAETCRIAIKGGESLAQALNETRLFPEEFVDIVDTAEAGGREPDMFQKQAELYHEQATTKIRLLAIAAGWFVWAMVAAFIIFFIFQIALKYINMINDAAGGNFDSFK